MADILQNNFNNGEISPDLYNRFDLSKYFNSCQLLQGFITIPQGGATLQPGTYFCGEVKDSTKKTRLIPFIFSETQAYQLEFGNYTLRFFFKNRAQVISTDGTVTAWVTSTVYYEGKFVTNGGTTYRCAITHTSGTFSTDLAAGKWVATNIAEISTPYGEDDLAKLKVVGSLDVMYIFHPDYAPRKLTRYDHTYWALTTPVWNRGPFKKENETAVTITPSATTGSITLTASSSIFNSSHVGSYWQISHWRDIPSVKASFGSNGYSASLEIYGDWEFETHDTWGGDCVLQRSHDNGSTWETYRKWNSREDYNVIVTGNELKEGVLYRFGLENITNAAMWGVLKNLEPVKNGVVKITGYTSGTVVSGTVIKTLHAATATKKWSEPLWSDYDGWPTCGCFHEERLFMGRGNSLAASKSSDFENMEQTDGDDSAMVRYLANNTLENIHWIKSAGDVVIAGTASGIWKVEPFDTDKAMSNTNLSTRNQSSHGTDEGIDSVLVGNLVVYIHRQSKIIEAVGYSPNDNKWVPSEINILFKHLTKDYPIIDLCYQETQYPILWGAREDGLLFGISYNTEHKIIGLHRHPTDGEVESVSVCPGDNNEDSLWMIVDRDGTKCVEATMPYNFGDQENAFFVKSGLTFDGGDQIIITGITKADPAVVTCTTTTLTDGDQIRIREVSGMTEVNNKVFTVDGKTGTTINLKDETGTFDIDSSAFTAYESGGALEIVENTFSGLTHLAGKRVSVIGDGAYYGEVTVSDSGVIILLYFFNKVHAGLFDPAILKPVKVELPMNISLGPVSLKGSKRKVHEIIATLEDSLGGIYGEDEDDILPDENLIKNGNFEADYAGTEWVDINTPETSERATTDKYEGSYSYHIIDSTPSYGGRRYLIEWIKNKRYQISFWYKIISGTLLFRVHDNNGDLLKQENLTSTNWIRFLYKFQCKSAYGSLGKISFNNSSNSVAAEFYFDHVECYEIKNLNTESKIPVKQGFLIPYLQSGDTLGEAPALFTGEKRLSFPGGFETGGDVVIVQNKPLPMTVTSILYKIDSYGI